MTEITEITSETIKRIMVSIKDRILFRLRKDRVAYLKEQIHAVEELQKELIKLLDLQFGPEEIVTVSPIPQVRDGLRYWAEANTKKNGKVVNWVIVVTGEEEDSPYHESIEYVPPAGETLKTIGVPLNLFNTWVEKATACRDWLMIPADYSGKPLMVDYDRLGLHAICTLHLTEFSDEADILVVLDGRDQTVDTFYMNRELRKRLAGGNWAYRVDDTYLLQYLREFRQSVSGPDKE